MKDFESEEYLSPPQGLLDPDSSQYIQNIHKLEDKAMADNIEQMESEREFDRELIEKLLEENRFLKEQLQQQENPEPGLKKVNQQADSEEASLQDAVDFAKREEITVLESPASGNQLRDLHLEEMKQSERASVSEGQLLQRVEASDIPDASKVKLRELLAIRDTPEIRMEIDRTNRIAQRIHEKANVSESEASTLRADRIEGRVLTAKLDKHIQDSNLAEVDKEELTETLNHLTNKALGHEPRPFAPDYRAPSEPTANRQARIKSIVDHYKPIEEKERNQEQESVKEAIKPNKLNP